jgi:hypothetical protein
MGGAPSVMASFMPVESPSAFRGKMGSYDGKQGKETGLFTDCRADATEKGRTAVVVSRYATTLQKADGLLTGISAAGGIRPVLQHGFAGLTPPSAERAANDPATRNLHRSALNPAGISCRFL